MPDLGCNFYTLRQQRRRRHVVADAVAGFDQNPQGLACRAALASPPPTLVDALKGELESQNEGPRLRPLDRKGKGQAAGRVTVLRTASSRWGWERRLGTSGGRRQEVDAGRTTERMTAETEGRRRSQ